MKPSTLSQSHKTWNVYNHDSYSILNSVRCCRIPDSSSLFMSFCVDFMKPKLVKSSVKFYHLYVILTKHEARICPPLAKQNHMWHPDSAVSFLSGIHNTPQSSTDHGPPFCQSRRWVEMYTYMHPNAQPSSLFTSISNTGASVIATRSRYKHRRHH